MRESPWWLRERRREHSNQLMHLRCLSVSSFAVADVRPTRERQEAVAVNVKHQVNMTQRGEEIMKSAVAGAFGVPYRRFLCLISCPSFFSFVFFFFFCFFSCLISCPSLFLCFVFSLFLCAGLISCPHGFFFSFLFFFFLFFSFFLFLCLFLFLAFSCLFGCFCPDLDRDNGHKMPFQRRRLYARGVWRNFCLWNCKK